ncbi:MAG: TIGR02266 family protein [Myxococcales bacterium]|nr:TIGR02266 family protein [Myxococcales bacterium]
MKKERRRVTGPAKKERRVGQRRAHPRVPVKIEVDYRSDDNFLFAYITDLSAMGIFVKTTEPHPPGARLTLRFKPLGAPEFVVDGQVVWINPVRPGDPNSINPGMGIQFVDLDPDTQRRLTRLVRTFAYLDDEDSTLGNS